MDWKRFEQEISILVNKLFIEKGIDLDLRHIRFVSQKSFEVCKRFVEFNVVEFGKNSQEEREVEMGIGDESSRTGMLFKKQLKKIDESFKRYDEEQESLERKFKETGIDKLPASIIEKLVKMLEEMKDYEPDFFLNIRDISLDSWKEALNYEKLLKAERKKFEDAIVKIEVKWWNRAEMVKLKTGQKINRLEQIVQSIEEDRKNIREKLTCQNEDFRSWIKRKMEFENEVNLTIKKAGFKGIRDLIKGLKGMEKTKAKFLSQIEGLNKDIKGLKTKLGDSNIKFETFKRRSELFEDYLKDLESCFFSFIECYCPVMDKKNIEGYIKEKTFEKLREILKENLEKKIREEKKSEKTGEKKSEKTGEKKSEKTGEKKSEKNEEKGKDKKNETKSGKKEKDQFGEPKGKDQISKVKKRDVATMTDFEAGVNEISLNKKTGKEEYKVKQKNIEEVKKGPVHILSEKPQEPAKNANYSDNSLKKSKKTENQFESFKEKHENYSETIKPAKKKPENEEKNSKNSKFELKTQEKSQKTSENSEKYQKTSEKSQENSQYLEPSPKLQRNFPRKLSDPTKQTSDSPNKSPAELSPSNNHITFNTHRRSLDSRSIALKDAVFSQHVRPINSFKNSLRKIVSTELINSSSNIEPENSSILSVIKKMSLDELFSLNVTVNGETKLIKDLVIDQIKTTFNQENHQIILGSSEFFEISPNKTEKNESDDDSLKSSKQAALKFFVLIEKYFDQIEEKKMDFKDIVQENLNRNVQDDIIRFICGKNDRETALKDLAKLFRKEKKYEILSTVLNISKKIAAEWKNDRVHIFNKIRWRRLILKLRQKDDEFLKDLAFRIEVEVRDKRKRSKNSESNTSIKYKSNNCSIEDIALGELKSCNKRNFSLRNRGLNYFLPQIQKTPRVDKSFANIPNCFGNGEMWVKNK